MYSTDVHKQMQKTQIIPKNLIELLTLSAGEPKLLKID